MANTPPKSRTPAAIELSQHLSHSNAATAHGANTRSTARATREQLSLEYGIFNNDDPTGRHCVDIPGELWLWAGTTAKVAVPAGSYVLVTRFYNRVHERHSFPSTSVQVTKSFVVDSAHTLRLRAAVPKHINFSKGFGEIHEEYHDAILEDVRETHGATAHHAAETSVWQRLGIREIDEADTNPIVVTSAMCVRASTLVSIVVLPGSFVDVARLHPSLCEPHLSDRARIRVTRSFTIDTHKTVWVSAPVVHTARFLRRLVALPTELLEATLQKMLVSPEPIGSEQHQLWSQYRLVPLLSGVSAVSVLHQALYHSALRVYYGFNTFIVADPRWRHCRLTPKLPVRALMRQIRIRVPFSVHGLSRIAELSKLAGWEEVRVDVEVSLDDPGGFRYEPAFGISENDLEEHKSAALAVIDQHWAAVLCGAKHIDFRCKEGNASLDRLYLCRSLPRADMNTVRQELREALEDRLQRHLIFGP